MPDFETMDLVHTAVLWRGTWADSFGQQIVQDPPCEIPCRWVGKSKIVTGPNGNPITVDAIAVVTRDIPLGSIMWLGTEDEFYGAGSGGLNTNLMEVAAFNRTDDIKGRFTRRTVGLKLYKQTLPGE